jgi:hypothetical protein
MSVKLQKTDFVTLKTMKQKKKWQLLALNDAGKVVSLGGLKKIFWMLVILGLILLVAGGWGGLRYKAGTDEAARLKLQLQTVLQQMKTLQADTDLLLCRIMNAGSLAELRSALQKESSLSFSEVRAEGENTPECSKTAATENQESVKETEK